MPRGRFCRLFILSNCPVRVEARRPAFGLHSTLWELYYGATAHKVAAVRLSTAKTLLFTALLALGSISHASAEEWTGRVVGVTDGDTIGVMRDGNEVRVRLYGIDCPESGQDYGSRAKQYTSEAAFGKDVRVVVRDMDRYGRTVGDVYLPDGSYLNASLISAGMAWWYKEYAPKDVKLQRRHLEALTRKVGLWADPSPIPPWDYRKGKRADSAAQVEPPKTRPTSTSTTATGAPWNGRTVYITRTGSKYHFDGCRSLASSKIPTSIAEAVSSGYTPCSICKPPKLDALTAENAPAASPPPARSAPAALQSTPARQQAPSTKDSTPRATASVTVFITRTGAKYHRDGCRSLSASKIPTTLAEAANGGYAACSICDPPIVEIAGPLPQVRIAPPAARAPPAQAAERSMQSPPATTETQRYYQSPQPQQDEATVYVTKTGAKYHSAGCQYLRQSSIPMSLNTAKARYGPCSKCGPPR